MTVIEATRSEPIASQAPIMRSEFSYRQLAQSLPVKDNGEPLVAVTSDMFILAPFWEEANDLEGDCYRDYIDAHPEFGLMVRSSVLERLQTVSENLPNDWRMVIKAGYRPLPVQLAVFEALRIQVVARQPNWTTEQVIEYTRRFVSDPAIIVPPHSVGGAVDVDIISTDGQRIDMGCLPNTDGEIAHTHSNLVTFHQRANRELLLNAMLDVGFANLAHEWWHFSYGDQYWAAFYGHDTAIYDVINE